MTSLKCVDRRYSCLGFPAGFSLLEISVVLAIIAVVIAGTVSMGSSMLQSAQKVSTNQKLDAIETALMAYRLANNRLPCPGDPAVVEGGANYGYEVGAAGTCGGGNTASYTMPNPSAAAAPYNTTATPGGTTVVEGAIPVRTLNLPDEYQVDGWGRKFAYAVWTPLTAKATGATTATSPAPFLAYGPAQNCGAITVKNAAGGNRSIGAAYALISYGPDGHGGYLKNGTRYNAGVSNADEDTNAHFSSAGIDTGYTATYVQKEISLDPLTDTVNPFQHIVRAKERWQMQDAYDTYHPNGLPCWPGFVVNGANANDYAGWAVAIGDVNGDGIPDLVMSALAYTNFTGKIYVVFGSKNGFPDPLPLNTLNGTNGFELDGRALTRAPGGALAVADVNGDGIADIIIGTYEGQGTGNVYVVFGHTGTWNSAPQLLDAAFLDGTNGFELDGVNNSFTNSQDWLYTGFSVAAGDVNGDGIADIVIGEPAGGATYAIGNIRFNLITAGKSFYLDDLQWTFVNSPCATHPNCYLSNQTEIQGSKEATLAQLASDLTNAGTLTPGDGNLNLATYSVPIGSPPALNNYLYIIYKTVGNGGNSYTLCGATHCNASFNYAGKPGGDNAIASSVTLTQGTNGPQYAGNVYVLFGKKCGGVSSGFPACIALTPNFGSNPSPGNPPLDGIHGFAYTGGTPYQFMGTAVATGDVNGDGISDIIISGPGHTLMPGLLNGTAAHSAVYVLFGQKCGGSFANCPSSTITLTSGSNTNPLDGIHGAEFDSSFGGNAYFGDALATGDINGDGIADLFIGSIYGQGAGGSTCNGAGCWNGFVFGIFGKSAGWPTTATTLTLDSGSYPLDGKNGFELDGAINNGAIGSSLATGDVNGDGIADLVIDQLCSIAGLPCGTTSSWSAIAVFGSSSLLPWTTITSIPGGINSKIVNVASSAGFMIGEYINSTDFPTTTKITSIPSATQIKLSNGAIATTASVSLSVAAIPLNSTFINGINGAALSGSNVIGAPADVHALAAGDVNGDGIADIAYGASGNAANGNAAAGQVFVYFGRNNSWPTTSFNLGGL